MEASSYDFYLDKCLLPVSPEKLQIKINNKNESVVLINEGEVNILKAAGLTEVEFECLIPQVQYPFAVYKSGFAGASYFLDYFENLKIGRKPFQFIVSRRRPDGGKLFNTNMKVSMEDYRVSEDAKEGHDLTVKVKLKQWRDYGTKTVSISFSAAARPQAAVEPQRGAVSSPVPAVAQSYTVKKGDCLCVIANRFYGNSQKYTVIYDANRDVIGSNPNRIYPGQVLTIPAA